MHAPTHRILDANLNRAREALRVMEDHARFMLDDAVIAAQLKTLRHDLAAATAMLDASALLAARDTAGDVGTTISTASEMSRESSHDVAAAAAKRATEALRCLEEYGKAISAEFASKIEQLRYQTYIAEQSLLETGPRRTKLRAARLHVLITESLCKRPWLEVCEQAIAGGADVLQLREKSLPDAELLDRAYQLRELTAQHGVLFIVNDRPDIARLAGADGVHVGQDDLPIEAARLIAGPTLLVGRSTHSIEQVREADAQNPDYIAVGPMFLGATKPDSPVQGPVLLSAALAATNLPLVAIGGLTPERVIELTKVAGDRSFQMAVSQSVITADDPTRAARVLKRNVSRSTEVGESQMPIRQSKT